MAQAQGMTAGPLGLVPVELTICVGRTHPTVSELMALTPGAVLPLDRDAADPVEIYAGDRLVARGALEEVEGEPGMLAVRLIEIVRCDAE